MSERESAPPPEIEPTGPNPLAIVFRRWPLLAVGLAIGAVIGAVVHLATAPTYQSAAQLHVFKKRTDVIQGGDGRVGVLEDYMATQLTIIRSERVRNAAARLAAKRTLNHPPAASSDAGIEAALAEAVRGGLAVMRDKDSTSPGQIGSGVLNLAFRSDDPADAKTMLEAVIEAYKADIGAAYERATEDRIKFLDKSIETILNRQEEAQKQRLDRSAELRRITTEEVANIRMRVTSEKNQLYMLQLDLIDLKDQLELIEKAGKNRRDRLAALVQLTASARSPGALVGDPTSAESNLRALEAKRKELGEEYGKDHPQMRAVDAQIAFFQAEIRRQNPEDPEGQLDELAAYGKRAAQKRRTADMQAKQIEARLAEDEKKIADAGGVQDKIEMLLATIKQAEQEVNKLQNEKSLIQATNQAGGYTADTITQPAFGGKVTPVLYQSVLMGLAIGLMIGGAAVGLAELTDKSFRSPAEVRRRLGLPIVGFVPQIRRDVPLDPTAPAGVDSSLVAAVRPKSADAEAFRGIRTQLYFSTQGRGNQVIQVTSPIPGDGKSTLAANLAVSIAQSGKRVVLVDADFRKPRIHKIFNLGSGGPGLAGAIDGSVLLPDAIQRSVVANLDVLPCGKRPDNPAELLTSPRFQEVLAGLKANYAFVIIDTPPLLAVSDPAAVAPRADGVLMVFRMTGRARPSAERAREQLAALGANVLGLVVNGWSGRGRDAGDYNYGYGGDRYSEYRYADDYTTGAEE